MNKITRGLKHDHAKDNIGVYIIASWVINTLLIDDIEVKFLPFISLFET